MVRPTKSDDEKLNKTIAFRITDDDFAAYKFKFSASGMTQSEFFREYVLTNSTRVIARSKLSSDGKRAVFLMNKASNNINQLAHRANSEHLAGMLSESTFMRILNQLEALNSFLLDQANEAKK